MPGIVFNPFILALAFVIARIVVSHFGKLDAAGLAKQVNELLALGGLLRTTIVHRDYQVLCHRARKLLAREVDPLSLSDRDLTEICNRLNATPRKCLGYKTPAEVFRQKLLAQIRRTS